MERKPVVAGMFYDSNKDLLIKQIEEAFKSGPGLPTNQNKNQIKGIIVPHAGYVYSATCASFAYKEIAESKKPDIFILLGPNHTGLGTNSICGSNFKTPLGIVETDLEFAKILAQNSDLEIDNLSHDHEHSIEVQIPFLQFITKPKIIAISLGIIDYIKLGKDITKTIKEQKKTAIIIASSDFMHYGINYNYVPFFDKIKINIEKMDNTAFSFIKKVDPKGFIQFCEKTGNTICGKYPIATLLSALPESEVEKLCHYNSGDIAGDYSNCVDYISAILK